MIVVLPEVTLSGPFQQGCSQFLVCAEVWGLSGPGVQFSTSYWYFSAGPASLFVKVPLS